MLGKTGFDAISVAARPGVSDDELARADRRRCCPTTRRVATGDEQASADRRASREAITFIRDLLLGFGGIALFVGAFVIFNTLSITVAQRSREFATLRTLGASRRQVMRSVVAEAAVIGVVASLVGLGARPRPREGADRALRRGRPRPAAGRDGLRRRARSSSRCSSGTVVTLLASIVPAIRATRVPPIAAVREGAALPASAASRRSPVVALAAVGLAGAMLVRGLLADGLGTAERLLMLGGGDARAVHRRRRRLVAPGPPDRGRRRLADRPRAARPAASRRENAVRNPSRTAATAAALMIGLALVTFVAVLGAGLIGTARSDVRDQISADHVVTSTSGCDAVPTAAGRASPRDCRASSSRACARTAPSSPARASRCQRRRPGDDREHVSLHLGLRLGRIRSRASAPTASSWTTRSPRTTASSVGSRVPLVSPSGDRVDLHGDRASTTRPIWRRCSAAP